MSVHRRDMVLNLAPSLAPKPSGFSPPHTITSVSLDHTAACSEPSNTGERGRRSMCPFDVEQVPRSLS